MDEWYREVARPRGDKTKGEEITSVSLEDTLNRIAEAAERIATALESGAGMDAPPETEKVKGKAKGKTTRKKADPEPEVDLGLDEGKKKDDAPTLDEVRDKTEEALKGGVDGKVLMKTLKAFGAAKISEVEEEDRAEYLKEVEKLIEDSDE